MTCLAERKRIPIDNLLVTGADGVTEERCDFSPGAVTLIGGSLSYIGLPSVAKACMEYCSDAGYRS